MPDPDAASKALLQRAVATSLETDLEDYRVLWIARLLVYVLAWARRQPAGAAAYVLTVLVSGEGKISPVGGPVDLTMLD